jgi:hypothetical protein
MPQPRAIVPDSGGVFAGFNNSGSTILKGRLVKRATTGVDHIALATDGTAPILGVTMADVPDQIAGDVQRQGRALVQVGGVITIGQLITGAATGKGAVAASTNQFLGVANTTAAADLDFIEVDIQRGTAP